MGVSGVRPLRRSGLHGRRAAERGLGAARLWIALACAAVLLLAPVGPARAWDPLQKAQRAAQQAGEHLAVGETAEAVEAYLRAQALDPEDPRIRMGVGEALFQQEELESAMAQFLAAADPDVPETAREALYNAGNAALALGEAEKALGLYEQAVLLGGPEEDLLFNLELAQTLLENQQGESGEGDPSEDGEEGEEGEESEEQQQQDQQQQEEQQQQGDQEQEQQQDEQEQQQEQEEEQAPPDSTQAQPPAPADSTEATPPDSSLAALPEGMTPEEAMRLLEALDHDEEELRKSIQRRLRGTETESEHDW